VIIVVTWPPIGKVCFPPLQELWLIGISVDGDYALEVFPNGKLFGGDASVIREGGKRVSGLARYCNDMGTKNNIMFAAKEEIKRTWGVRVKAAGYTITRGQEIFV